MEGGLPGRLSACADRSNRAKTCPRRGTCGGTPSDLNSFGVLANSIVHLRVAERPLEQRHIRLEIEPKNWFSFCFQFRRPVRQ